MLTDRNICAVSDYLLRVELENRDGRTANDAPFVSSKSFNKGIHSATILNVRTSAHTYFENCSAQGESVAITWTVVESHSCIKITSITLTFPLEEETIKESLYALIRQTMKGDSSLLNRILINITPLTKFTKRSARTSAWIIPSVL